jgi:hypothetical protein
MRGMFYQQDWSNILQIEELKDKKRAKDIEDAEREHQYTSQSRTAQGRGKSLIPRTIDVPRGRYLVAPG